MTLNVIMSSSFLLLIQLSIMQIYQCTKGNERIATGTCCGQYIFSFVACFNACIMITQKSGLRMMTCILTIYKNTRTKYSCSPASIYIIHIYNSQSVDIKIQQIFFIIPRPLKFLKTFDRHDCKIIQKESLISIYQEGSQVICWLNNRLRKCR